MTAPARRRGTDKPRPLGAPLTERELEVLKGMALGKPNAEIGRGLWLSEETIKTHARRLFQKLGARDRAHAVWLGCMAGYLVGMDGKPFVGSGCQCGSVAS